MEDADRYTITFTRATGDDQKGDCPDTPHNFTVSVDAPTTSVNIVQEDDILELSCTYITSVIAVSDVGCIGNESQLISFLTPHSDSGTCVLASIVAWCIITWN